MDEVKNPADAMEGFPGEGATAVADTDQPSDTVTISDPADQLAAITNERDQLAAEKAEMLNRFLRRQAEFENYRKRVERERMELLEFAGMEAVRAVLPIADDFERALKVECADKEYARGMELIYQRLVEALAKQGLEPIISEGQKFDPNLHHAVSKAPSDDVEEDTVLEEFQKGYNFKGKLLRPAMVKVSVKS